jgi:hypothetical protein
MNRFVMCLVSFLVYVKVNHLCSFSGGEGEGWVVSFGGVVCVRGDREGIVMEDVVDNVFFTLVFFCVEVVGV